MNNILECLSNRRRLKNAHPNSLSYDDDNVIVRVAIKLAYYEKTRCWPHIWCWLNLLNFFKNQKFKWWLWLTSTAIRVCNQKRSVPTYHFPLPRICNIFLNFSSSWEDDWGLIDVQWFYKYGMVSKNRLRDKMMITIFLKAGVQRFVHIRVLGRVFQIIIKSSEHGLTDVIAIIINIVHRNCSLRVHLVYSFPDNCCQAISTFLLSTSHRHI